jgi:hypothetical protein
MIRTLYMPRREQWVSKVGHACLKQLIIVMQQDVILLQFELFEVPM